MKVTIEKFGINGEGVTHINNMDKVNYVGFIPFSLPGEEVDVDIVDRGKYFDGVVKELLYESPDRVIPVCPYYYQCGGCDIQHMNNKAQLDFKRGKVVDALKYVGGIDCCVSDVVRLNDWAYRNKMVWPYVKHNDDSILGMFERSSHKVVGIDGCMLADLTLNHVYEITKDFLEGYKIPGYDFKRKEGVVKYVVARTYAGSTLVTIVATRTLDLEEYYAKLQKSFKNIGLSIVISDSGNDILSGKYKHLYGIESLEIDEFGIKYKVDNRGFLQVNNDIKSVLYNLVLNQVSEGDIVLDAYSGAGLLSAIIAKKCKSVTAIEINKSAHNSAVQLAKDNNLSNINFINADVKSVIGQALVGCNVVVLDPPRSGCHSEIINSINENVADKIVYVSCNPATLARDLKLLNDKYIITKVIPLDMFPQTKHVETLVVLEKKE